MKKLLLILMFGIVLISFGSALDEQGTGTLGQNFTFVQGCDDATYITLSTIQYPNRSVKVINTNMTSTGGGSFQYNLTDLAIGRHDVFGISDGCERRFAVFFHVTHSGGTITEGASSILIMAIIFMLVIGSICLFGFFRKDQHFQTKWTLFIFSFIFYLAGANIISALIGDTLANPKVISFFDSFMSISFILFWFAFGLLAIIWFLTMLESILFRKKQKQLMKYGELHG